MSKKTNSTQVKASLLVNSINGDTRKMQPEKTGSSSHLARKNESEMGKTRGGFGCVESASLTPKLEKRYLAMFHYLQNIRG
jgi:hypothetical protein